VKVFFSSTQAWFGRLVVLLVMGFSANVLADEAVDFTLPGVDGKMHSLSDYRGKWVVVNYWATWCPPCLTEIPELVDFHEESQAHDAVVLGINFEDIDRARLKGFIDDYFINYPVLIEQPGRRSALGDIPGLPTTYLISPEGEIVARQVGEVTAAMLREFIDQKSQKAVPGFLTSQNTLRQ
jgi:peroxiredoxin